MLRQLVKENILNLTTKLRQTINARLARLSASGSGPSTIHQRLHQNPAPLAGRRDEQKKLETEADYNFCCPKHTARQKAICFPYR